MIIFKVESWKQNKEKWFAKDDKRSQKTPGNCFLSFFQKNPFINLRIFQNFQKVAFRNLLVFGIFKRTLSKIY